MNWPVRDLRSADRALLAEHFLALGREDRRLRFGAPRSDSSLRAYIARIDFDRDAVFGVLGEELRLLGVAHVGRADGQAELGISVLQPERNHGVGAALLERATLRARNWGKRALYMHCLSENGTMMRLAHRQGMRVVVAAGEADAWLDLPAANAASYFGEAFANNVALFDHALKRQRHFLSNIQSGERFGG